MQKHRKVGHGMKSIKEKNKQAQYKSRRTRNGTINDRMYSAKTRAKDRGLDYNLTLSYLISIWEEQEGRCKLSGAELGYTGTGWSAASLDRIDPDIGYIEGNVQWVCWRINDAKSNMTNQDFINMCTAIAATFIETIKDD